MNLWIVTIGSSDVQLDSDRVNRDKGRTEKQRSDKVWQYWYDDTIKSECYDIPFEPKPAFKDSEESYRIAPRILGIVYELNSEEVKEEIRNYLTFPLLSNFTKELKKLEPPEAIAILLTDQSEIFKDDYKRRKPKCPYWQDTCELEGIVTHYLKQEFPGAEIVPLILSPQEEPGLDDWDRVLIFVRDKLDELDKLPLQPDTVYVSHQAGTPAISSAVQFSSLAKFRTNVKFLVSNEYSQETRPISRSTYLGAIQRQEAEALLKRHDYAGVKLLVYDYLPSESKILLDAAIQWNLAKFNEFANEMQKLSDQALVEQVNKRSQHWWWTAYEAAYLAVIRHRQKNIVEALFHSFRSVEGLVCQWAEEKYKNYILYDKKGSPQIIEKIEEILPEYWEKMKEKNFDWIKQQNKENENRLAKGKDKKPISVGLFSQNLYSLLECVRPECKQEPSLKKGLYSAKDERNQQFHRLLGLLEEDLFKAWKADNVDSWKSILLGCLNFITNCDLPKAFTSLEEASLMAQVDQKLKQAIERYEL